MTRKNNYLAPMDTVMTLSRLSLHHCSTSYAKVALNIALLTLWEVQARKMEASWSLKPVLPSSNSLSDSSTTSHSTLRNNKTTCRYLTGRFKTLQYIVGTHEEVKPRCYFSDPHTTPEKNKRKKKQEKK